MFDNSDTPPSIVRLIALLKTGYRIDERASVEVGDTLWLEHPARRTKERTLLLSGDGWLVGMDPLDSTREQLRIPPSASEDFNHFVRGVPRPTWWEANGPTFYPAMGLALLIAMSGCIYGVVHALRSLLTTR